ncbi:MAG: DUF2125 domain-containing protein [Proteobacteria bacterium]|nr:DUF2125 domain-containing protein [Pseudomonadota bacterium]
MIQRKYLIPIGVVALLVTVWTLGWFWFAREIQTGLQAFAGQQDGRPVIVTWDGVRVSGYPNRLNTHITRPRGTWSGPDGNITWTGADTILGFFKDGGRTVSFRAPGAHDFTLRSAGSEHSMSAVSEGFGGRLVFDGKGQATALRGLATGLNVAIDDKSATMLDRAAFDWSQTLGGTDASNTADGLHPDSVGQSLTFSLSGVSLVTAQLDPILVETLGRELDRLAGQLSVRGALDPTDLSPDSLTRWRDAGGTLELANFSLVWGPLQIFGDGTLAVDDALQPVGAFTAQIAGIDRLINLLEQTGRMRPQQAAIARIALAVLTRAPANGGPPQARVPVSVQNRQLSIGPIPLLQLPVIDWN